MTKQFTVHPVKFWKITRIRSLQERLQLDQCFIVLIGQYDVAKCLFGFFSRGVEQLRPLLFSPHLYDCTSCSILLDFPQRDFSRCLLVQDLKYCSVLLDPKVFGLHDLSIIMHLHISFSRDDILFGGTTEFENCVHRAQCGLKLRTIKRQNFDFLGLSVATFNNH